MNYKVGVTHIPNRHTFCIVLYQQCILIYLFYNSTEAIMNSRVSGQCYHAIVNGLFMFSSLIDYIQNQQSEFHFIYFWTNIDFEFG